MSHLLLIGWDARRVLGVGSLLIHIVHAMGLTSLRMVDLSEIDQAAERWTATYRGGARAHGTASPLLFVMRARQWLRFHGFLILPTAPTGRFDAHLAQFKSALELRGLASCTINLYLDRSQMFLQWLSERHNDLSHISVNDVDDFLVSKREAGWRLRTLAGQRTALRSFFTYAEGRGWCARPQNRCQVRRTRRNLHRFQEGCARERQRWPGAGCSHRARCVLIGHRFCLVRHSLKPATASSSEIPSASKTSCQRVVASRIASLSASLRLRRAGMK